MATLARRLAHRILVDVERGGCTLGDRLASPEVDALAPRERGFLHEMVLGTLRHRGAVDHQLRPLLSRDLARLDRSTRAALRLGTYQIRFMRVPDRAAVSESVDLLRGTRAAGLVNAVLRRLATEPPVPDARWEDDPEGWLTTAGSLPRWLAQRWLARLGPARTLARAQALLRPPAIAFRLNPRAAGARDRLEAASVVYSPLPVPGAFALQGGRLTDLAVGGVVAIQAQGSQLVAHLAATPGWVLDACAAPGGKATLMADLLLDRGRVVALEPSPRRMTTLAAQLRSWGCPNLHCVRADAGRLPLRRRFDSVLLDAPCSGLGTLSRNPDIRWRATPADLVRHSRRQAALLKALAGVVEEGGLLVYSACSLESEENEQVIEAFRAAHPEFEVAPLPAWAEALSDGRFARTTPEADGGDGIFAAVLRRASAGAVA